MTNRKFEQAINHTQIAIKKFHESGDSDLEAEVIVSIRQAWLIKELRLTPTFHLQR